MCGNSPSNVNKSLEPVIELLKNIIQRLELKGDSFSTYMYDAAVEDKIEAFWEILQQTNQSLAISDTSKNAIKDKKDLLLFISYCS